jgi:hypothetical protein
MRAAEARKLKIGDFVRASFGGRGVVKKCEIIRIDWPVFTLRTKDYLGHEMIRTRRYASLINQCEANGPRINAPSPVWLKWQNS